MFSVKLRKVAAVAAALPLPEHWLSFSNLDFNLPQEMSFFLCYKKQQNTPSFGSSVSSLKKALAQVLVPYYPLAGEVVSNSMGEPEMLCNNRGVDFLEASADVELRDLDLYNPRDTIDGKLVPGKKQGVPFSVQATELRCGSLVLGLTFDHRLTDGYSLCKFLGSWAEATQSKPISDLPCFRRSLLSPRRHQLDTDGGPVENMYIPISRMPAPTGVPSTPDDYSTRIYYVKEQDLDQLQSLASSNGCKRTKLESFAAFLWQMLAKFAINGDESKSMQISKMGISVDGRTRLNDEIPEMIRYYGNVLFLPSRAKKVSEIIGSSLSSVANEVHELVQHSAMKEHLLGLIDLVEANRPELVFPKMFCNENNDGPKMVISSGQRFPISKWDFGMGKPVFGSCIGPSADIPGYVVPMPSPAGNGDWVVYMQVLKKQLEFIESEAAHFFRPFSFDYLKQF